VTAHIRVWSLSIAHMEGHGCCPPVSRIDTQLLHVSQASLVAR
jgi:hypothetical protein